MTDCKNQIINCNNMILRTGLTGKQSGHKFLVCKLYPECSYQIPLDFDESIMTVKQKKTRISF